ncbi:HAD family phosphatase [Patescibacteria group bacterium]|nr:MAG: HAD family phosphatase [Patescibacteria group bacterium]
MLKKQSIKAVIFDMDGVISDTQDIHAQTESEILKDYGINLHPDKISRRFAGVSLNEMFPQIFNEWEKDMPPLVQLIEEKWERITNLVKGNVKEVGGTLEFIASLKNFGLPLAVASASHLSFIDLVLGELNLKTKFNAVTSAQEVERGKPEPDIFLLAARRLNAVPEDCLVIEDGISGMIAAKRAGMQCIGLVRGKADGDLPEVDLIVPDLRHVQFEQYIKP